MTNTETKITVEVNINAPVEKVWQLWTNPVDITNWNSPSPEWHIPKAENDLRVGGKFLSRMEAKDGSFGFDFGGEYNEVNPNELIVYTLDDGRKVENVFIDDDKKTKVSVTFDAETENSLQQQQEGWQAILDSFKQYAEKTELLEFTIQINTDKKKVWEVMLDPITYKEWSNAGWEGSSYIGNWVEGENLKFVSPSGEGTVATLVSHKPYDFSHAKHVAVLLKDGTEDRESELAKGWVGIHESYTFTEKQGVTTLKVLITSANEWVSMFTAGWPVALKKLKEICER